MDEQVKKVNASFREGSLTRREALKSLFRLGMTAPAAYVSLGIIQPEEVVATAQTVSDDPNKILPFPQETPLELTRPEDVVTAQTQFLTLIASHPSVQEKLGELQRADPNNKESLANELMETIRTLPELQENSTDELRLSLRVFENEVNQQTTIAVGDLSKSEVVVAPTLDSLNQTLSEKGLSQALTVLPYDPASDPVEPMPIPGLFTNQLSDSIDPTTALTVCGSVGYIVCVSVGG